ncbi:MAG: hypothetical protein RLZZ453_918 [Chlamydiota bacterium]
MALFPMIASLFFVLNALGNIPLFVGLLAHFTEKQQRKIVFRELCIALVILLLFTFFGDNILNLMGISQSALGVAGGTLLFLIALGMIFPRSHDSQEIKRQEPLIVPLAIPLVAGPGSLSMVMIYSEQLQNGWLASMVVIFAWIPTCLLLLLSTHIKHFLGQKGLLACEKLGGMIVALIAVNMICTGFTQLLQNAFAK